MYKERTRPKMWMATALNRQPSLILYGGIER